MKYKPLFLCLAFGLAVFTSCEKENFDNTTIEEDEIIVEVVTCDSLKIFTELVTDVQNESVTWSVFYMEGGTPPYAYNWSTGETANSITVFSSGIYSVTVTDAEGCSAMEELDLEVPSLPCASFSVMAVEDPAGTITANTTGGTIPYTYSWSTGETTNSIVVTSDGVYSVTATDANGCIVEDDISVIVSDPCASLAFGFAWQPIAGILGADVWAGTPPYAYGWSTGETTETIPASTGNTYSVTVTDALGCTKDGAIQL